jgi:hypothetical protein
VFLSNTKTRRSKLTADKPQQLAALGLDWTGRQGSRVGGCLRVRAGHADGWGVPLTRPEAARGSGPPRRRGGDGGFEEHITDAGAELGVGPAGLLLPGEPDTAPGAGAADVPDQVRPARPEWIVQLGISTGRPPVQAHAGDCYAAGNRHRPVDRDEARRLLASGLPACPAASPTSSSASSTDHW